MSYRFADSLRAGSGRNQFRPDPARKNKFEKLVRLVGFILEIYHDARSPERQIRKCGTLPLRHLYTSSTCTEDPAFAFTVFSPKEAVFISSFTNSVI